MLIPDIYICNKSDLVFNSLYTDKAIIHQVNDTGEIKTKALLLYITDNKDDIRHNDDKKRRTYFVYTGNKPVKLTEKPYVLDVVSKDRRKDKDELLKRWVDYIIKDYQSHIYKTLLQTLIDTSPDMIWFKDREERHVILNKAFCDVVQKDYDYCLNKKHPDIWDIPWEEYESSDFACRQSEEEIMRTGKTGVFQEPVLTGGTLRQFTTYKTPIYDAFGEVLGTCGIGHDVTNVSHMGKELDIFLSAIPYPAFLCDRDYNIQRMNASAENMTGMTDEGMHNYKTWKQFFLQKEEGARTGEGMIYMFLQGSNRTYYSVIERDVKDFFENVSGHLCMLRDVTYQCMYEDLMFQAANIDPLTGAYNRRYFYETINAYIGKPLTLLYMDLDNFKRVNDTYGHGEGDMVLKDTVRIIQEHFPEQKIIRLGGDEFALMMPKHIKVEALKDKLLSITENISKLEDKGCGLGISIGYETTTELRDVEEFMKKCDERMYEKKHREHSTARFIYEHI